MLDHGIDESVREILKRTYALLYQSPSTYPETEKEMLEKIYSEAQRIRMLNSRKVTVYKIE